MPAPPPILIIAGGIALILYGVRTLHRGLDRIFGAKLGPLLQQLVGSRFKAFLTGIGAALMAPSSTTISVLAVQTLQAGHLSTRRMLALMLGADVGRTVTVLMLALHIDQYAPILILVGLLLYRFPPLAQWRGLGQAILGLGLIFLAMDIIKTAAQHSMANLAGNTELVQLIQIVQNHPYLMALASALLAFALQSSTVTIGLVMALGAAANCSNASSLVSLSFAIAVIAGANVGIVFTTMLAGWTQLESRRLAMGNLLAKGTVALLVLITLPAAVWLLDQVPATFEKKIAYAHTGFNLLVAGLFLPLIRPLSCLAKRLIFTPPTVQKPFGPRYINTTPIESLALGTGQSLREIMRVAEIARSMLNDMWLALGNNDAKLARTTAQREDQIDLLDVEIKSFLTRLSSFEGEQDQFGEQMRQFRFLNELETIGDIIDKNLSELVIKKVEERIEFSKQGWAELDDVYHKVVQNMLIAETAFTTRDRLLAQQLLRHKQALSDYDRQLRDRHFARLKAGLVQTHESSAVHLDMLTYLKRINSSVTHIAYAILQDTSLPTTP